MLVLVCDMIRWGLVPASLSHCLTLRFLHSVLGSFEAIRTFAGEQAATAPRLCLLLEMMKSFFPRLIDRCRCEERPCPVKPVGQLGLTLIGLCCWCSSRSLLLRGIMVASNDALISSVALALFQIRGIEIGSWLGSTPATACKILKSQQNHSSPDVIRWNLPNAYPVCEVNAVCFPDWYLS